MWRGQVTGPLSQGLFLCRAGPSGGCAWIVDIPSQGHFKYGNKIIHLPQTLWVPNILLGLTNIANILLFTLSYAKC